MHGTTLSERREPPRSSMKTVAVRYLTIVRHAKAEKAARRRKRFRSRTLNGRGRRQCEQLRAWASDESELGRFGPTTALVSAAARTSETFRVGLRGHAPSSRTHRRERPDLQRASRRDGRRRADRSRRHRSRDDIAARRRPQSHGARTAVDARARPAARQFAR